MKIKKDSKKIKELKKQSRDFSIRDGIFTTIRQAVGDSYIAPFAIALNASNSMVALLASIPGGLGPLGQWFGSRLTEKHSRKKIITKTVFFEILMWIPLILIAFLFHKGILISFLPLILLIFFSLFIIFANIGYPAWFSWIGDLVDEKNRGKWFAKRNFFHGLILLIFAILASVFLDFFKGKDWTMFGFIILFSFGIIARYMARNYIKKQYEPKIKLKKGYYFSFFEFIKKAPSNNFGKFTIFRALMNLAANVASPFFAVYMLRNLEFSYFVFMSVIMAQTIFTLLIVRVWGKFADKFGNYNVLKITSILISIYPLLWLISDSPIYLIFGPQLIGGIGWSGFLLCGGNFIFDSIKPQKRSLAVSYYSVLRGAGIFSGAAIGAILIKNLTINFMDTILFIFLISGFLRLTMSLIMVPKIKEIRKTKKIGGSKALKYLIFNAFKLSPLEDIHELVVGGKHSHKK